MRYGLIMLIAFLITLAAPVFSQGKKTDSLLLVLKNAKGDTSKVNTLNALVSEFRFTNPDTAFYFVNDALALATVLDYDMGIADSKLGIGMLCDDSGKYGEGIKSCNEALGLYNKLILLATRPRKEIILAKIGRTYNEIGRNGIVQGNYPEGLKNSFLALKIREELGDKKSIALTESNIGVIYFYLSDYTASLKHFSVTLKICHELGDKEVLSGTYMSIGNIYSAQGNYAEALKNYSTALKLAQEVKDTFSIGKIYSNLGDINERLENYSEALKYYFASLKIFKEIGINEDIALMSVSIGSVYTKQKKFKDASEYANKGLAVSKEVGSLEHIKVSYEYLARLDSAQSNFKQALQHYKLYITTRDSLVNIENTKKMVQHEMQYEFSKKEDSLSKKQGITETKLQVERKQKYFYWAGLFMLGVLSIFVFLNFRNQKKLNKLASETHARQKTEIELQSQQAILNERLRISSELHDEVGATLSGIAMYSHLTKEQMRTGQTSEIEKSLNVMQQSSAQMVDKLNDIVWLINPEQDSLQKLVERLEEYARDMAAIKNMQVKITIPDKIEELNLPVESRRNIYLFCKEAINNAVKYSQGSLLELKVKEINNKLEFSVSDDGKGFDAVMVRRGNGLENMQKRADEIGARLVLHSKEKEGVYVSIQCSVLE
jgi:two-component system sensor histidine kinase UhpB